MIRRLVFLVGGLLTASYLATLVIFQTAKRARISAALEGSRIVSTKTGPVEYGLAGRGSPVLILPGSFGGFDQAMGLGRELDTAGFVVIGISRPGYLGTPLSVGRSPAEQAEAFAALIDTLGMGPVAVVAASGGGPAALELASRYPDRVSQLVLISALSGPKALAAPPVPRLTRVLDRLFGDGFHSWWQMRSYQASGVAVLDAPIFGAVTKHRFRDDPDKLAEYFRLAWYRFPPGLKDAGYRNDREQFGRFQFDRFGAIRAVTLVVHGTADRNVPIEHGDRSAQEIAGAEYLKVDGGDHYVALSQPELVWERVRAFLRGQAR